MTILQIPQGTEFTEKQATGRNVATEQATNGFHSFSLPPPSLSLSLSLLCTHTHTHTHTHSQQFHLISHPSYLTHLS